jgi:glycosyltransferase involved in cell wall biosynthesis
MRTTADLALPKVAAHERRPVRVCMHVQGPARTDARVMREATALAEAGYEVSVVDLERDHTRPRTEDFQGVHLRHVVAPGHFKSARFKPWFLVKFARVIVRGCWAVIQTPAEVYHAHDDKALPACFIASRVRRKPLVFDAHELPLSQPNVARWRRLCALAGRALRLMVPRCSSVITVSAPIAREIRQRYGGPDPVLVRNLPAYQPATTARDELLRRQLQLPPETRIALYQGGLVSGRSLDVLIRAARFLDPGQVIVLMGDGAQKRSLQALIAAEGVGERVRLLPAVPYEDLLSWTASADLGLILYRASESLNVRYCLPNKLFEYLAAGVPVLASELDAVAELLAHYDAGVVAPSLEPATVAHSIGEILGDDPRRERLARNALAATATDLRWDVERQQLLALYGHLRAPAPTLARKHQGSGGA